MTPNNDSGHGRGQYASPSQAEEYIKNMSAYLARRNAAWLDRWTDRNTGEVMAGIGDLCNLWAADDWLVMWAIDRGLLDPASRPEDGIKNRQIGLYSGIVYHRSEEGRRAIAFALEHHLDELEFRQIANLAIKEASCP